MKELKIRITFIDEVLGSANSDPNVHSEFIASKAPDALTREHEIEALGVDSVEKKEKTIFPRDKDGNPILWPYQMRGFIKHAIGMVKLADTKSACSKIKAHKKYVDGLIYIWDGKGSFRPNRALKIESSEDMGSCQRPLRASTMQGERVALANSESIAEGATITMVIRILKDDLDTAIEECLDYGQYNGLGQWRNSGKGSFTWEKIEDWKTVK